VALIELETFVAAPPERCFDLSLSVELHLDSTEATGERAIAGRTSGRLGPGDEVTWRARHFGLPLELSVRITQHDRPRAFRDEMIRGPLRRMRHDHRFEAVDGGTRMLDSFEFAVAPLLDSLVLAPHFRAFLLGRNELIKRAAEGDASRYLCDADTLLAAYDEQLRAQVSGNLPEGVHAEVDGPLVRVVGAKHGGFIGYRDLGAVEGAELDELIARQVRVFAERGEAFEWKLHGHDRPADLADRLRGAGFVAEDVETVMIAPVERVAAEPILPPDVRLREVGDRADLDRIAALEEAIWHDGRGWLADSLEGERAVDPNAITIVVAEAGDGLVCAAWVRFAAGTEFATLWGGGTLPAWRGRGIYRAIVAYRANLAAHRGLRYLQVDASDSSRPILERLGFVAVTTTTPFIWSPEVSDGTAGVTRDP